jgi:HlyD family secretion protein
LIARRKQAEAVLSESQSVLDDFKIAAPSSGMITTRLADAGEVVAAGSPLFDIVDLDRLYLKVYVPEIFIGKLRLGLPARIYIDAFADRYFDATVKYIASNAQFTPKEVQTPDERVKLVYAVKLYLKNNPDHRLSPGLPADAIIQWKEGTPWAGPQW